MTSLVQTAVLLVVWLLASLKPALADNLSVEAWNIFRRDAISVLADIRDDLYAPNVSVSGAGFQFIPFPGEVVSVDSQLIAIAGCRPHSCVEKGIAVIDKGDRRMLALGLRHFHCRLLVEASAEPVHAEPVHGSRVTCDKRATLSIYVVRWNSGGAEHSRESAAVELIRTWAANFDYRLEFIRVIPAGVGKRPPNDQG